MNLYTGSQAQQSSKKPIKSVQDLLTPGSELAFFHFGCSILVTVSPKISAYSRNREANLGMGGTVKLNCKELRKQGGNHCVIIHGGMFSAYVV